MSEKPFKDDSIEVLFYSVLQRQLKRQVKVMQLLSNKRKGKFILLARVEHPKQTCVLSAFPLSASTVAF